MKFRVVQKDTLISTAFGGMLDQSAVGFLSKIWDILMRGGSIGGRPGYSGGGRPLAGGRGGSLGKGGGGSAVLVIVFWGILMFGGIFVSPRVERVLVVSNEHGIWGLPHGLPNDSKLRQLVRHLVYNKFISNKHDSLHLWQEIRKYQDLKTS